MNWMQLVFALAKTPNDSSARPTPEKHAIKKASKKTDVFLFIFISS
jgi:hypothetical protein